MMKKDPVRLYGYFILLLMIKTEYKVLGGWTVMQKSVLSEKYPWQDKTVLFSINSSNSDPISQSTSKTAPLNFQSTTQIRIGQY